MRGGALPILAWAMLLALSGTANAVWTGDGIQIAMFGASVATIVALAIGLILRDRSAASRGAPEPRRTFEALPRASVGALLTALGIAMFVFGFAFGHFPIYLGIGVFAVGIGRLAIELRTQHRLSPKHDRVRID